MYVYSQFIYCRFSMFLIYFNIHRNTSLLYCNTPMMEYPCLWAFIFLHDDEAASKHAASTPKDWLVSSWAVCCVWWKETAPKLKPGVFLEPHISCGPHWEFFRLTKPWFLSSHSPLLPDKAFWNPTDYPVTISPFHFLKGCHWGPCLCCTLELDEPQKHVSKKAMLRSHFPDLTSWFSQPQAQWL